MKWQDLVQSDRYAEAVPKLRQFLTNSPDHIGAQQSMAKALRATGQYRESLSFYERVAAHHRQDEVANKMAPGSAPWDIDIACLHWLCGDRAKAMQMMHGLAAGILDGSIQYASDAAGGMTQGLLLYYMALSENKPEEMSFALSYLRHLRDQLKRIMIQNWPYAVASYYLGDIPFAKVMEGVDERVVTMPPIDPAMLELGRRIRLCDALFHDGVKARAQGNEAHCLARMRECAALENPVVEQEWYLARYEVEKGGSQNSATQHHQQ